MFTEGKRTRRFGFVASRLEMLLFNVEMSDL